MKALTIAYQISHHYRETIFKVLIAAIVVTSLFYAFLLQKTIVNAVQIQKISKEVKTVTAAIGGLEESYFSLKNSVTLDLARTKGLKNADTIAYISKKPVTAMAPRHEF